MIAIATPRFSATIHLLNRADFLAAASDKPRAIEARPFSHHDSAVRLSPTGGFTTGAMYCSILAMMNQERASLFHLYPPHFESPQQREELQSVVTADFQALKTPAQKNGDDVSILITGGYHCPQPTTTVHKRSHVLYRTLLGILAPHVPRTAISRIWGLRDTDGFESSSLHVDPKTQRFNLWVDLSRSAGDAEYGESLPLLEKPPLRQHFKTLRLAPRTRLAQVRPTPPNRKAP